MTATSSGIYFTDPLKNRIGYFSFSNSKINYVNVPYRPTGIAISAEQTFINVGMADYVFGYSFKLEDDGSLSNAQPYIHYHVPYGDLTANVKGMTVDSQNLLYSATSMGVQVSDQLGRINFIFSKPGVEVDDVKLGGKDFETLYISSGGKLFSRKINAKGVLSALEPVKPPKPGL